MVYNGKPYQNWWFGGTTIFGNTQFMLFHKKKKHHEKNLPTCRFWFIFVFLVLFFKFDYIQHFPSKVYIPQRNKITIKSVDIFCGARVTFTLQHGHQVASPWHSAKAVVVSYTIVEPGKIRCFRCLLRNFWNSSTGKRVFYPFLLKHMLFLWKKNMGSWKNHVKSEVKKFCFQMKYIWNSFQDIHLVCLSLTLRSSCPMDFCPKVRIAPMCSSPWETTSIPRHLLEIPCPPWYSWWQPEIRQTHQLSLVVYPVIYRVLGYIPGGDRQISEPSTVGNPSKGLRHCEWKSISLFYDAEIEKIVARFGFFAQCL